MEGSSMLMEDCCRVTSASGWATQHAVPSLPPLLVEGLSWGWCR